MKQRKRVRANTSRMAWRAVVTRLLWDMLVLYEAIEEKLD